MSTTVSRPASRCWLESRRAPIFATIAGLLAATGCAFALIPFGGSGEPAPSGGPTPKTAQAWPRTLTTSERAAVSAGLTAPNARIRRLAGSVAAGGAGALALADPAILHHHGVNTAAVQGLDRAERAAERFHHRSP